MERFVLMSVRPSGQHAFSAQYAMLLASSASLCVHISGALSSINISWDIMSSCLFVVVVVAWRGEASSGQLCRELLTQFSLRGRPSATRPRAASEAARLPAHAEISSARHSPSCGRVSACNMAVYYDIRAIESLQWWGRLDLRPLMRAGWLGERARWSCCGLRHVVVVRGGFRPAPMARPANTKPAAAVKNHISTSIPPYLMGH